MFRICMLFLLISSVSFPAYPHTQTKDKILVIKSERILLLLKNNKIAKEYKIALGKNPVGDKVKQGDNKTPEGKYQIVSKNSQSKFYLNLAINYPSKLDIKEAKRLGVNPGGNIVIHGLPNKAPSFIHDELMSEDWTNGCIALHNSDIKDLFDSVPIGTSIDILP